MLADRRERGAEVDGGRGLADAALLVGEGDHPGCNSGHDGGSLQPTVK
jgi:hypothetical protein